MSKKILSILSLVVYMTLFSNTDTFAGQPKDGFSVSVGSKIKASLNAGSLNETLSVDIIKSLILQKVKPSISFSVNVDDMAKSIYSELEAKLGIDYRDKDYLENSVIDSITKRVGITGLSSFVDESNAILDKEWNIIYDGLGIPQPKSDGNYAGVKEYFNVYSYDINKGIDINLTYSAVNDYIALDGTAAVANYKILIQKDDPWYWFPTKEYVSATGKQSQSVQLTLPAPGRYFVTAVKTDWFDSLSKIKWKCKITQSQY